MTHKLILFPLPGVLWLSVISEFMYIGLLAMGFLLMWVESICLCAKREMNALKINAFAAMCTVLSGEAGGRFLPSCYKMSVFNWFDVTDWQPIISEGSDQTL